MLDSIQVYFCLSLPFSMSWAFASQPTLYVDWVTGAKGKEGDWNKMGIKTDYWHLLLLTRLKFFCGCMFPHSVLNPGEVPSSSAMEPGEPPYTPNLQIKTARAWQCHSHRACPLFKQPSPTFLVPSCPRGKFPDAANPRIMRCRYCSKLTLRSVISFLS